MQCVSRMAQALYCFVAWFVFCEITTAQPDENTQADAVRQKYGLLGRGQTVAIIDSGIAYDHFALGGGLGENFRVVGGRDFTSENDPNAYDDPGPLGGHGTQVASVATGNVGSDGPGVAPNADLVALRVFGDNGSGFFNWVESALRWVHENRNAFENPITTVNLSIGFEWNSTTIPPGSIIEDELAQLKADGIFIAASAGNSFTNYGVPGLAYPAASPHVVPAMSVDSNGQLSFFSQRHPIAIAAPGRLLQTAVPDYLGNHNGVADDFSLASGTDMSAPFLAGASVIVREAFLFNGASSVTQQTIYNHLLNTADETYDSATDQEYKRLNLLAAVDALMPADDFGSTTATAAELGTVNGSVMRSGIVGTTTDIDYFTFIAGQTGTARIQSSATNYLRSRWTIQNASGGTIVSQAAQEVSFAVTAGNRYYLGLSTEEGIGRFTASLVIGTPQAGDYSHDGRADAADYTLWRNALGSTTNLQADGNGNGIVDQFDYNVWKSNFSLFEVPLIPGDYSRNGIVDAADYTVWRNSLGRTGLGLPADGNLNGQIDIGDYNFWRAHFGQTIGSGSGASLNAAVPEPTTLVIFLFCMTTVFCRRRTASKAFIYASIGSRCAFAASDSVSAM